MWPLHEILDPKNLDPLLQEAVNIPQLFCVSHKNWLIFCILPFLNYVKRALQRSSVIMRQKLTPIRKKNYQSIQIFLQTGNTQFKSKLNKLHFQGNSLSWLIFLVFFSKQWIISTKLFQFWVSFKKLS